MTQHHRLRRRGLLAAAPTLTLLPARHALAQEVSEVRVARQFGIIYLPLLVVQEQGLLTQEAERLGLGRTALTFIQVSGGAATNDALLSGSIDLAAAGIPPVITLWSRTRANLKVRAVASLGGLPFYLTTRNPSVRTIADFTSSDRIAVPAVRVSFQSVVLQIAAEKTFGAGQHERLEPLTVGLPHPDATAALIADRGEITAHFGNPPFQNQQLEHPHIKRVLSSYEVLGGPHSVVLLYGTTRFRDANPRTVAAFVAALDRANAWIHENPRAAAELYARVERSALSIDALEALLRDPDTQFSTEPRNVGVFATFLARTGRIPEAPADWRELFFPELHERTGS